MVDGFEHKARDELHGFWDVQFVEALGRPPAALAQKLLEQITPEREAEWKQGTYDDWAMEAFDIAFTDVYGETPLSKDTLQHLDAAYVERAEKDVALQLSRAGIRLAAVLNKALGRQVADKPRWSGGSRWGLMQDVMAQWVINLPDCGVPATAKSGNLRYPSA